MKPIEPLPVRTDGEDPDAEFLDEQESDPTLGLPFDPATGEFVTYDDEEG